MMDSASKTTEFYIALTRFIAREDFTLSRKITVCDPTDFIVTHVKLQ